jgi:hypothetical protein
MIDFRKGKSAFCTVMQQQFLQGHAVYLFVGEIAQRR